MEWTKFSANLAHSPASTYEVPHSPALALTFVDLASFLDSLAFGWALKQPVAVVAEVVIVMVLVAVAVVAAAVASSLTVMTMVAVVAEYHLASICIVQCGRSVF